MFEKHIIKVKKLFDFCLSDDDGKILRNHIISKKDKFGIIEVDFADASTIASPFLNASFGYLIMLLGKEAYHEKISIINIPDYALKIYETVLKNALTKIT